MENHPLLNMYWMPKMHENLIKAILISAFSKSSIKSLARTITFFVWFLDKYKHIMINVGFPQTTALFG